MFQLKDKSFKNCNIVFMGLCLFLIPILEWGWGAAELQAPTPLDVTTISIYLKLYTHTVGKGT